MSKAKRFKVTCPHCKAEYICTPGGVSLHCWDYKIEGGGALYGILSTGELECPKCRKSFKEKLPGVLTDLD